MSRERDQYGQQEIHIRVNFIFHQTSLIFLVSKVYQVSKIKESLWCLKYIIEPCEKSTDADKGKDSGKLSKQWRHSYALFISQNNRTDKQDTEK